MRIASSSLASALALVIAVVAVNSAQGATLQSHSMGAFLDNSILPSSGDVVYAVNIGGGAATTASGVAFGADDQTNITFETAKTSAYNAYFSGANTGDANFNTVLNFGRYSSPLDPELFPEGFQGIFTLNNLTINASYELLVLVNDTRDDYGDGRELQVSFGGGPFSAMQRFSYLNGDPSAGGYWKGTFTADATTQDFRVRTPFAGNQVTAIVLSAIPIPEPASLALLGSGLASMMLVRRRRKS